MANVKNTIMIENAHIFSRNFSGAKGEYNNEGNKNFCVFLDPQAAERLKEDGWNIRALRPKDEDTEPQPFIQVSVSYTNIPPKVLLISSRGKTILDEESIKTLDFAEIKQADLVISPYNWDVRGQKGVKAYLKSLYVTIVEDELDLKYSGVPDSAAKSIGGCGNCDACDGHCKHEH